MKYYLESAEKALEDLQSGPGGLSGGEAASRLAKHGPNQLAQEKKPSLLSRFFAQLKDPMQYNGPIRPGQFFEVSIPKYGEAPISVSGIGPGYVDLTIRRVGKVTNEVFEHYAGQRLLLRGPYGNGFEVENYQGRELVIIAGGTGVSPIKGVVDYFTDHPDETKGLTLVAGFKTPHDILFRDSFPKWEKTAKVILTVDCAEDDVSCHVGLVTQYIPQLELKNVSEATAIVVGPPVMLDELADADVINRIGCGSRG